MRLLLKLIGLAASLLAGTVVIAASCVHAQSGKDSTKEAPMPFNATLPPQKAMTPAERDAMER